MQKLGVPYSNEEVLAAVTNAQAQAADIGAELIANGVPEKITQMEVVAMIAYMQRLGIDYGSLPETPVELAGPEVK
jgi:cbb3-type cytochrome oxidase cytochrome c subunit